MFDQPAPGTRKSSSVKPILQWTSGKYGSGKYSCDTSSRESLILARPIHVGSGASLLIPQAVLHLSRPQYYEVFFPSTCPSFQWQDSGRACLIVVFRAETTLVQSSSFLE